MEAQSTLDSDLWWFFQEASSDISGLAAAPLEPSYGGGTPNDVPGSRLDAAAEYRDIESALGALSIEDYEVLKLAHTPVPPALRPKFAKCGELTHVVVMLAPSAHWVLEHPEGVPDLVSKARRRVSRAVKKFRAELKTWRRATRRR